MNKFIEISHSMTDHDNRIYGEYQDIRTIIRKDKVISVSTVQLLRGDSVTYRVSIILDDTDVEVAIDCASEEKMLAVYSDIKRQLGA